MVHNTTSVGKAYATLGVEQGTSLEEVKSTYKRLALATHPDKNPDPEATVKFQELSEAYNVLLKQLDKPQQQPRSHFTHPFHSHFYHSSNDDDDEFSEESDDYDSEYYEDGLDYYMFIFEELMKGRSSRQNNHRFFHQSVPQETEEEYNTRIRIQNEEAAAARERRAREEAERKARVQKERMQEAEAAMRRQKAKAHAKKASHQASTKSAVETVRQRQKQSQELRSATFAAARRGDSSLVKKGVWEAAVDAAGGEVQPGHEEYVKEQPADPKETLLHLAVRAGDQELVEWLDTHNSEADERDSLSRTAFHIALQQGHVSIIKYFLETYPPHEEDSLAIITPPAGNSLLKLAAESCDLTVVELVFTWRLADRRDISAAWSWVCSPEATSGRFIPFGEKGSELLKGRWTSAKWEKIKAVIFRFGDFTPPPTPRPIKGDEEEEEPTLPPRPTTQHTETKQPNRKAKRHMQTSSNANNTPQIHKAQPNPPQQFTPRPSPPPPLKQNTGPEVGQHESLPSAPSGTRTRGRGRGRGRGRD